MGQSLGMILMVQRIAKIALTVDYLTDNLGFGVEKRKSLNVAVLDHSRTFRYHHREKALT